MKVIENPESEGFMKWWWVMSPGYSVHYLSSFSDAGFIVSNVTAVAGFGYLGSIRPSISLIPETMISDGDGTVSNPYQVFSG